MDYMPGHMLYYITQTKGGESMTDSGKLDLLLEQLQKINNRLDIIELKQDMSHKKFNDLSLDIKLSERNIRNDIHTLQDEMENVIEVLKQNELVPN